jgi:hypothetical protein
VSSDGHVGILPSREALLFIGSRGQGYVERGGMAQEVHHVVVTVVRCDVHCFGGLKGKGSKGCKILS